MIHKEPLFIVLLVVGIFSFSRAFKGENMKDLTIRWQRLVDEKGHTCERCGLTEGNVHEAFSILQESLAPLNIQVKLEENVLDPATCAKDISESNRIWINDRPLEEWLGANVDKSPCDFCCDELGDDAECRTITINATVYETIPSELIIKAGLLAASQLVTTEQEAPCCNTKTSGKSSTRTCCPESDSQSTEER